MVTRVAIVGGVRTPFCKAGGELSSFTSLDLGLHVVSALIERIGLDPQLIDDLFFGTVLLDPRYPNLSREIILRSGLPKKINGHFVSNNCITGLVAASCAVDAIRSGRIKAAVIGGSESMSTPTLTYPRAGEKFFLKMARQKSVAKKLGTLASFRPGLLIPRAPSPKEPSTGLTMGQHCELMAQEFAIPRTAQDELAYASHMRATQAQSESKLSQDIVAVGEVIADGLIRAETSLEKLAGLAPVFDKSGPGTITAGNASALTDGASAICLTAEDFAIEHKLTILGFIEALEFASVSPSDGLLMAPGLAVPRLMASIGADFSAVDVFEIHEAFAAQVLCNQSVWEKGWSRYPQLASLGVIPSDRRNIYGGSIALGHPFAATGGRLLMNACRLLADAPGKRALLSICAAGGGAGAVSVLRP